MEKGFNIKIDVEITHKDDPDFYHHTGIESRNLSKTSLIEMEGDLIETLLKWKKASE